MADIKFTGNIGADSELRFLPNGNPVLNFSVADSKSRKKENGEWETLAEQWLRVTVWGELAEFYAEKLLKGTRVTVWGDFMSRKFEKDGVERLSLDVTAKGIEIFQKRDGGAGGFQGQSRPQQSQPSQQPWGGQQQSQDSWGAPTDNEPPF